MSTTVAPKRRFAYLFDVDGVLTNPVTKTVSPEIINALHELMRQDALVVLNTGRSISWLQSPLLAPLLDTIKDHTLLSQLIIIGEKGACWIHGKDIPHDSPAIGEMLIETDPNTSVSDELQAEIRSLTTQKFADTMFYDESKQTMVTIEMKDGEDLERFEVRQKVLVSDLIALLDKHAAHDLNVDPTRIATDVENSHVGKALGAQRMLELMKADGLAPGHFTYLCFGDSRSDIDMAKELSRQKLPVSFIFVGAPDQFGQTEVDQLSFEFIQADGLYDRGTIEQLARVTTS